MLRKRLRCAVGMLLAAAMLLSGCIYNLGPPPAYPAPSEEVVASTPQAPSGGVSLPPEPEPSPAELLYVDIPAPSLANNLIGEADVQQLGICLPPGYQTSDKSYPVLYFLTGFQAPYIDAAEFFFQLADGLGQRGMLDGMIVVVVNGQNRLGGSFYANSPVTGNWEDYVTGDVMSHVEANYRAIPEARARGLAGHSMGGAGAINIAMHRPGLYDYVYAMSPAIFDDDKGFAKTGISPDIAPLAAQAYAGLAAEDAVARYIEDIANPDVVPYAWYWSLAYGSAFAGDAAQGPPYIQVPSDSEDPTGVWARYYGGCGALKSRVVQYAEALRSLKAFGLEYGEKDENTWIPEGTEYFIRQLDDHEIPYRFQAFDGHHYAEFGQRLEQAVLPFFSEMFDLYV